MTPSPKTGSHQAHSCFKCPQYGSSTTTISLHSHHVQLNKQRLSKDDPNTRTAPPATDPVLYAKTSSVINNSLANPGDIPSCTLWSMAENSQCWQMDSSLAHTINSWKTIAEQLSTFVIFEEGNLVLHNLRRRYVTEQCPSSLPSQAHSFSLRITVTSLELFRVCIRYATTASSICVSPSQSTAFKATLIKMDLVLTHYCWRFFFPIQSCT